MAITLFWGQVLCTGLTLSILKSRYILDCKELNLSSKKPNDRIIQLNLCLYKYCSRGNPNCEIQNLFFDSRTVEFDFPSLTIFSAH